RDPGVRAPGTIDGASGASAQGAIVPLPGSDAAEAAVPPSAASAEASEALLALPKNAAGAIPTDFELGPDAKIAQSFFSPVICATVARVTGPPGSTLEELVAVVPETGIVVPNDVYASAAAELAPAPVSAAAADPYASLQYGLAVSGVRAARELGSGEGVRIALLDSPPELAHRDLAPGRIEAVATEPKGSAKSQPAVHGTLMAGVIGAAENNGFGIAGLAPRARIVSIPVCTASGGAGGQCTIYQMLQGFDRAYDAKAVIVNLSLSGPPNPLLERGVARLEALGLVVVAAAGNEGRSDKRYPAAYPSVIGVGAIDREGKRFASSNRGSWVELYAPGVEVLSTVPGSAFAFG
ncbi:MAG: S8 family serine peptidase, partial [Thermoleophilia bacterium]|nr:S8 family serine peptidase [Thermoleophilia bacterium]